MNRPKPEHAPNDMPTMSVIRVAIAGAAGRMGQTLVKAILDDPRFSLAHAFEQPGHEAVGLDAGKLAGAGNANVAVTDTIDGEAFDTLIDFTVPAATLSHGEFCRREDRQIVIGTTGMTDQDRTQIEDAAADIGIVLAPNMSVGVNLCLKLLEVAAQALGDTVDIEVIESHHRNKIDAPSGTALRMGEVIAAALDRTLAENGVFARQGQTGVRGDRDIGFATVRAGDIVGEHSVMFASTGERVEIAHKATSRAIYATGALRAAAWLAGRETGLYDLADVLGLNH